MKRALVTEPCTDGDIEQVGSAESVPGIPSGNVAENPKPHFMLLPSLACPAECSYCFGPHHGPVMTPETMEATLGFIADIVTETGQNKVHVTFHGGEPLVAGHALWRQALEGMRGCFGMGRCKVTLQSNLWLLDDEFCELFREHNVEVGSSLDGPEDITDAQRGVGYFAKTMEGIRTAQRNGLSVGCIATFTPQSAPRWREVFDFFLAERIGFSIHAAVPSLWHGSAHALEPSQEEPLLREMLDYYVEHRRELAVSTLDQMCQGVAQGEGKVCTFRDCLGMFLAIDPSGDIYPCQRFCGHREYRLGMLSDAPTLAQLMESPTARRFAKRQEKVRESCAPCAHLEYCNGGCTYNAWSNGEARVQDNCCEAYRAVFDHIQQRLLEEMGSEENIAAIAERPWDGRGNPLLKKGPLIELAREGPHPSQVARTAKRIVAAVELARGPDIPTVAARLVEMGIARTQATGEASLRALYTLLYPKDRTLNNLYVHATFRCQLKCKHCYARADVNGNQQVDMSLADLERLIQQAKEERFRQVVLTGGEPLIHIERDALLEMLQDVRERIRPMNLVLRTNLAMPLQDEELISIASAADKIIVSVDGNAVTHDERRGSGSYAAVTRNLDSYGRLCRQITAQPQAADLSLACVLPDDGVQSEPAESVRQLAIRLGIRRVRFRPLLPLGRAKECHEPPTAEGLALYREAGDDIEHTFRPVSTCGIERNLYIEPNGDSFPCYACRQSGSYLGNAIEEGLAAILEKEGYRRLSKENVDSISPCSGCDVRYLCGGSCRAWSSEESPGQCNGPRAYAERLLQKAQSYLNVKTGVSEC